MGLQRVVRGQLHGDLTGEAGDETGERENQGLVQHDGGEETGRATDRLEHGAPLALVGGAAARGSG